MPRSALLLALLAALGCPEPSSDDTDGPGGCEQSTSLLHDDGEPTGFERCADGSIHRVEALATDPLIPEPSCAGDESWQDCTTDADCTFGPHGKCAHVDAAGFDSGLYSEAGCTCVYSCASDAECGDQGVCVPPEVHGVSEHSECASFPTCIADADCASGECGYQTTDDGCGPYPTLSCRTEADTCRTNEQCTEPQGELCFPPTVPGEPWECTYEGCADGRPLRVDGVVCLPTFVAPTDAARAAWAAIGAAEHASVAGFARFVLQLQALGAPSTLVAEAVTAMADEVRHARDAFAIAGTTPGPMDLSGMTLATDPRHVLTELIVEACVGETLNAASAALGATTARPDIAALLRAVADDETRHAALGWKTVRWILAEHPHLVGHARATLERAELPAPALPDLPAWGLVGGDRYRTLARQTVDEVVRPLLAAITGPRISEPSRVLAA